MAIKALSLLAGLINELSSGIAEHFTFTANSFSRFHLTSFAERNFCVKKILRAKSLA